MSRKYKNPIKEARKKLDNVMTDEELDEVIDLLKGVEEGHGEYNIKGVSPEVDRALRKGKVQLWTSDFDKPRHNSELIELHVDLHCVVEERALYD